MISFLVFLGFLSVNVCDETVKYAAVIYRHGDRTPLNPYPTDPWRNESLWPVKFGELTNIGKFQHYSLGLWFRKRYSHLLSKDFDPSEVYIRSTDVDRTLMSAQANLAGMYPPVGKSVWDVHLMWQPIPVHTMPQKEDMVLAMSKKCIAYNKEKELYINSKAYKERLSKYQGLMDILTSYTGVTIKDYLDMQYIYNTLYIETLYNFTLPNWTHTIYPDKLREPSCYSFRTSTGTPLLARLKVGPLLKEIASHMNSTMKNHNSTGLKLSMYSAHDDTVASILNSMRIFDGNCPEYTATVLMELIYDNSTMSYFIRISYRNSTEIVEPHILNIPYCGKKCPVERFMKLYENLLTVNWEHECGKQYSSLLGIAVFTSLIIFATICVVYKMFFARATRQNGLHINYSSINSPTLTTIKA